MDGFDRERWTRDGFVLVPSLLDAGDLDRLRQECDRLVALAVGDFDRFRRERLQLETDYRNDFEYDGSDPDALGRQIRIIEPLVDISPAFRELAERPDVTAPARAVLGGEVRLFEDKLNLKLPGGAGFPWHQDWSCCWRAHTDELVTCFLYLDDSTPENGCLQVVPRSHAGKKISPFREGSEFAVQITQEERARVTALPLGAGDLIVFDPYLLHHSAPNRSARPRRAIIYTYNPARLGDLKSGRFPEAEAAASAAAGLTAHGGRNDRANARALQGFGPPARTRPVTAARQTGIRP